MVKVSVVIPNYNYGHYLGDAIFSVLRQSYEDLELIIVDDGSTDDTRSLIYRYSDPRIYWYFQPHKGISAARNFGIHHSRGEYIAFLDADDYWAPTKIEEQVKSIRSQNELGLIYSGFFLIDQDRQVIAKRSPVKAFGPSLKMLLLGNIISGSSTTAFVPRHVFDVAGEFDEQIMSAEDWDMWIRISEKFKILAIDKPLAFIRLHSQNTTSNIDSMDVHQQAVIRKFFQNHDLPPDIKRLRRRAFANVKLSTSNFAFTQKKFKKSAQLSCESLLLFPFSLKACSILLMSLIKLARSYPGKIIQNVI
jgi:glycosyltransferase involved in cell wall biosynthesis